MRERFAPSLLPLAAALAGGLAASSDANGQPDPTAPEGNVPIATGSEPSAAGIAQPAPDASAAAAPKEPLASEALDWSANATEESSDQDVDLHPGQDLIVAGVVLTVGGLVAGVTGGALFTVGEVAHNNCLANGGDCIGTGLTEKVVGVPLIIIGSLMTVVGIPLWAVGVSESSEEPAEAASASASLRVGPAAVDLRLQF